MGFFQSLVHWFAKGGAIMWPILIFSLYGIALCYERWMKYQKEGSALALRWEGVSSAPEHAKADEARYDQDAAADRLARAALTNGHLGSGARIEKVRHAFHEEQARIDDHLGTISVVATLLPMLGLLGTVIGMIASFSAIAEHGTGNPRIVADGISEALITTEAGLITSIPLFYLHQLLGSRAEALSRKLDEFTTHMLLAASDQGEP